MINDKETREVTLESLGRILELERRMDVLGRVVMEMRTDQAAKSPPEDTGLKNAVLESPGRILELERQVDTLSRTVERERLRRLSDQMDRLDEAYAGEETLIHQDEPSPLDPEKLRDAMEKERQRVKQTSDDLAYQGSACRLRLAARKFINPRGRFEDLRPEINEILRRKYPATEERLSCPPAPPAVPPQPSEF